MDNVDKVKTRRKMNVLPVILSLLLVGCRSFTTSSSPEPPSTPAPPPAPGPSGPLTLEGHNLALDVPPTATVGSVVGASLAPRVLALASPTTSSTRAAVPVLTGNYVVGGIQQANSFAINGISQPPFIGVLSTSAGAFSGTGYITGQVVGGLNGTCNGTFSGSYTDHGNGTADGILHLTIPPSTNCMTATSTILNYSVTLVLGTSQSWMIIPGSNPNANPPTTNYTMQISLQ